MDEVLLLKGFFPSLLAGLVSGDVGAPLAPILALMAPAHLASLAAT